MHLMYVDESGDCGYPRTGAFPARGGPTRYFVRAGVVLHGWRWMHVKQVLLDFKHARGLRWNAEIKAGDLLRGAENVEHGVPRSGATGGWSARANAVIRTGSERPVAPDNVQHFPLRVIRAGKGAFAAWSPTERQQFLVDLLDSIGREIDIHLLVVAIDKQKINLDQRERYTNPSVRSLELLLERYNEFLGTQRDKSGIAILDSVEADSDENLRYFQSYLLEFSDRLEPRRVVETAMFMPSHTTHLLQLADICSNVAYRRYARPDQNENEYARIRSRVRAGKTWP